jgi:Asp-tRNA(Asn)/Glu-tRNA(Gln) amidotransferase A subunit family amidase
MWGRPAHNGREPGRRRPRQAGRGRRRVPDRPARRDRPRPGMPGPARSTSMKLAYGISGSTRRSGRRSTRSILALVPGGSSSGSAVAVGPRGGGTSPMAPDTGGSIRIPAACCGVAGLKTQWGRVPLGGVWPLAAEPGPVGPMARGRGRLVAGMALLEPGDSPVSRRPACRGSAGDDGDRPLPSAMAVALRRSRPPAGRSRRSCCAGLTPR